MIDKHEEFLSELNKFFVDGFDKIEDVRYKNEVYIARVYKDGKTFIAKFFENHADAKEIQNYEELKRLGVKTLDIYYLGENLIVMQDIDAMKGYRVADDQDKEDDEFLKSIAAWYRSLHILGRKADFGKIEYSEYNFITKDNVLALDGLLEKGIFDKIVQNIEKIQEHCRKLEYTLVYNDFYYDNVVTSDKEAFVFDYDMLGKGCIFADINNVVSALGDEAGEKFLQFYGKENLPDGEDEAVMVPSMVSALVMASKKPALPGYAKFIINTINSEAFDTALDKILES